ncbi:MAG: hypothetical protein M3142_06670 [Bacteroidota bacterium]|nr:hypothetical protein [Bacteroidota bacterium]
MKKPLIQSILALTLSCLLSNAALAQAPIAPRLLYSAKLTFQAYGLPSKNLGDSFKNVGFALGIDYAYNQKRNLFQSFSVGYQSHTQHETGYYVNTQFVYRPVVFRVLEPSIGIGLGRMLAVSNSKNQFYEIDNGSWSKSNRQTIGHWQAPISLGLGFRTKTTGINITPFIGYEAVPIINYNSAFVVMPYSLLSVGSRFKF